jgi:hypothetical protein
MLRTALVAVAFFAAAPARAEPDYSRVLDVETVSTTDEPDMGRAVLVDNGDAGADLYIYLSSEAASDPARPQRPALVKKDAAWNGRLSGSRPSLETNARGALLVRSESTAIGRNKWMQTLTVVYRNKEFIVAGLTRDAYDSLEPGSEHHCDLNLLTGKGKKDGRPVEVKFPAKKLSEWSDGDLPKECAF